MAVLVTGGTGFVGLAVAEALAARGHDCVLFADRPMPEAFARAPGLARATFVRGDICSVDDIRRAIDAADIKHVVHLAAITAGPSTEHQFPRRVVDINVGGTATLLEVLRDRPPGGRVVVASSVAVYGLPSTDTPLDETESVLAPTSLYGITKLAAEQAASRLARIFGLDARIVRLGPVFGPWEYRSGVREVMSPQRQVVELARSGREVVLPRALAADWIYSRDAGCGIAAVLLEQHLDSTVFNLGGRRPSDLAGWCERLGEWYPQLRWRLCEGGETANVETTLDRDRPILASSRIVTETGFTCAHDQAMAAGDYVRWMQMFETESGWERER